MGRRALSRVLATLLAALVGAVLLSGSDQPVTAHPYPHWQRLSAPPLTPRTRALGLRVGHRLLVLGGRSATGVVRDGAAYDLRTGRWHALRTPVAVTDRDTAVAAAGVVVLRSRRGRGAAWWRFDPRHDVWTRMSGVPFGAAAPTAYRSEVYAVTARHVVVYSVALDRWTALPADPLRPALHHRRVAVTRAGTVVTGYAGSPPRIRADRWDGLRWRRIRGLPTVGSAVGPRLPSAARRVGATRVPVGARLVVVAGRHAWIHTP